MLQFFVFVLFHHHSYHLHSTSILGTSASPLLQCPVQQYSFCIHTLHSSPTLPFSGHISNLLTYQPSSPLSSPSISVYLHVPVVHFLLQLIRIPFQIFTLLHQHHHIICEQHQLCNGAWFQLYFSSKPFLCLSYCLVHEYICYKAMGTSLPYSSCYLKPSRQLIPYAYACFTLLIEYS